LPRFLDETLQVFGTDIGMISLYDAESDTLHRAAAHGFRADLPQVPMRPGEEIVGHVFATGEPYATRDVQNDPYTFDSTRSRFPNGFGGGCVPIRAMDQVIGTLFVVVPLPREIAQEEIRLLTTLAEIAGNAIQRTRLHTQTELQLRRLGALQIIDQAISASFDLNFILNIVLEQVKDQLQVDAATVLVLNPRRQTLECANARGFRMLRIERSRIDVRDPVVEQIVFRRQKVVLPDLLAEGQSWSRKKWATGEHFVTYIGVPLVVKGKVKGILEVWHRTPLDPNSEWMSFLERLAAQTAIAVDNAELFITLQRANVDMIQAYDATLLGWTRTLDLRDHETEGHSERVAETTLRLAQALGVPEDQLADIRRGALLHDIGKMGVPDAILLKPGELSDEEWLTMRRHPQLAYDLLSPIEYLRGALEIPYGHHEKWDGTGYPRGLRGHQIPLAARIFAVVDVWDALTSDRPYRQAWTQQRALAHIQEQAGKHFDPQIVEAFFGVIQSHLEG
jgi:HD-GYP domain-containing protein (c-di-GMP phosphodiesterase class II)